MKSLRKTLFFLVALVAMLILEGFPLWSTVWAGIHSAPIVIPGQKVRQGLLYPLSMYRLFRTDPDGTPVAIPFQIDEVNKDGDYVLEVGDPEFKKGNGVFDLSDELVFMGDDVGPIIKPKWKGPSPAHLLEIRLIYDSELGNYKPVQKQPLKKEFGKMGAVYLAVFFKSPPPLSKKRYVSFDKDNAAVVTSRYRYQFNQQNYLVVRGIEMLPKTDSMEADQIIPLATTPPKYAVAAKSGKKSALVNDQKFIPLIDSSTFYLKVDLKYFITLEVNHQSLNTALEAFKVGPVRVIVRVSFIYSFLKLNFELGMYTEVSFFSNAVFLPAILYNPLNGERSLNRGSGFYYGFAMVEDPGSLEVETNMPKYQAPQLLDLFKRSPKTEPFYWISATSKDRMMYVEISPSKEMRAAGNIPAIFIDKTKGDVLKGRPTDKALPLGQSPVNMALYLDLTKLTEGEHLTTFRLFFENFYDPAKLSDFKTLDKWRVETSYF